MPKQFQEKLLNFMESGHIKVDQMRKHYDFKIKGAKAFAACNEITRLSKPLQSRFRRLHLPPYTEEQFLEVSVKVLPKLKNAHVIGKAVRSAQPRMPDKCHIVVSFRSEGEEDIGSVSSDSVSIELYEYARRNLIKSEEPHV